MKQNHHPSRKPVLNMTEGNPIKLLITFAVPMLIGNIFQQLYNLADSVIVGKLVNANALAAIGASASVTFLFFALCNGIGSGGGIVTSQFFGSGDEKAVKKCITNTGYIMLVFPSMVGMIAYALSRPILELLNTPAEIMPDSLAYIRIMCVGIVFVSIYNFIASMLRALGDSRTPLYFLVISCVINVVLDIFFVYSLGFGVVGAGIATAISQLLSGFSCIIYAVKKNPYFKFTREDFRVDRKLVYSVIRLGIPLSLQFSMIAISCMALQRVVNSFGAVTVAAFTATSRIEQLIHQPYQTLGTAVSTYTGQNFGARKKDRIIEGYRKAMLFMAIFSFAMLPVMQLFGRNLVSLFVNEEAVIDMGAQAVRITSLFYVFLGTIYVIRGVLNGLGDAFFALLNGIVEVIGRFTVPILLTSISAIGLWGIWWSTGVVWFFSGFTAWLRYLGYKKKIFKEKLPDEASL
ncbi:MAG: MATE family efflux transporter [Lachnospiraceae bacterium]|nr:MATE family efflux transporter [Lachnospiraceae bacterium]